MDWVIAHMPLAGAAVCWHCCAVLCLAGGNVSETFACDWSVQSAAFLQQFCRSHVVALPSRVQAQPACELVCALLLMLAAGFGILLHSCLAQAVVVCWRL